MGARNMVLGGDRRLIPGSQERVGLVSAVDIGCGSDGTGATHMRFLRNSDIVSKIIHSALPIFNQ